MGFKDLFSRKKEEPKVEEKPVQAEEKKEEQAAVEPAPKKWKNKKKLKNHVCLLWGLNMYTLCQKIHQIWSLPDKSTER